MASPPTWRADISSGGLDRASIQAMRSFLKWRKHRGKRRRSNISCPRSDTVGPAVPDSPAKPGLLIRSPILPNLLLPLLVGLFLPRKRLLQLLLRCRHLLLGHIHGLFVLLPTRVSAHR